MSEGGNVMRHTYIIIGIVALAVAACTGRRDGDGGLPTVRLATVEEAGGADTLRYPGRVRAARDVSLSFRVGGRIACVAVREGDRVSRGQLLAELDDEDYRVQLRATEAEYNQVKAEAERVMALYADSGITANAYDKAVYGLRQMEAKLRHCEDELSYTRLCAPFGGTVQERLFDEHEAVGAGTPVLTLICEDAPEVELNLPAADYARRDSFTAYSCTFDIFPGEEYPLTPVGIAPKANANQLYTMRLRLATEGRSQPSPGMNTMVTIRRAAEESATCVVPTNALFEREGHSHLFVFNAKDSTVRAVDVRPVRMLGDGRCVVVSEALRAGESVVASGVHHISDGERVRPLPPAGKTNEGGLL